MPDTKPPFNPNQPYKPVEKPKFNPNESYSTAAPQTYKDAYTSVTEDKYAARPEDQLENTLNDIVKTAKNTILDSEKDVLRNILKNPNTTPEQAREAIQTIQGYHPKFGGDDRTSYYMKKEDNGVMMPKPLAYGEKPPKGYNVASVWGNKKEANDDNWYTDLGKSLYNGVVGAVEGVVDVAQLGTIAATGSESKTLNSASNALESLKFEKDEDLNRPIYNTEGIEKWADLLDKDRFDFSPEALWGTLNMTAESAASFFTGAGAAAKAIKGITGAVKLGKAGLSTSAFTGSFLTQLGDNIDNAKEAGLEGRDIAGYAFPVTAIQASVDAKWGIDAAIFKGIAGKAEKDLIKEFARTAAKDATGKLTKEGFKQAVKGTTLAYDNAVANAIQQGLINTGKEGLQEVGQDFVAKAGEQLYDKLSDADKAKFGTDATDAKSFGSYMQNLAAGLVGGGVMAPASVNYKKKYDEQSKDALKIVEGGKNSVDEFKANLYAAQRRGDLTEQERIQAEFKVDAYDKYWEQTKDLKNMDMEDKRKAFELSFNIEGLKSEIDFTSEQLSKMDPIAIAKIENKKELIKGLQKDLNGLLLKQDIQTETRVGQDTVNKIAKDLEEPEEGDKKEMTVEQLLKKFPAKSKKVDKVIIEDEESGPEEPLNKRRANNPKFDELDKNGNPKFNTLRPLEKKEVLHDYFDAHPELDNEIEGKVVQAQNNVWKVDLGGGKFVQFASSIVPEQFIGDTSNLEGQTIEKKDSAGQPYVEYQEPVIVKLESITGTAEGREGKRLRVLNVYNKNTGKYIKSIKEKEKGNANYHPGEIEQMQEIQKKGYTPKMTVKDFVDKIENDQVGNSPDMLQFYENNKEAIEAELRTRTEQLPELTEQEVGEELQKEQAREQVFAETGMFDDSSTETGKASEDFIKKISQLKNKPAKDVLQFIYDNLENKNIKKVAGALLKNASKVGFVKFEGFGNIKSAGLYYPRGSVMLGSWLKNNTSEQQILKTFLHEYVHAFSIKALAQRKTPEDIAFYQDVKGIYDDLKSKTSYPEEYGFTNIYEFVSEILSNAKFVEKLKSDGSIWQRIIDAIKKLFGIKDNVDTAIDDILSHLERVNPGSIYSVDKMADNSIKQGKWTDSADVKRLINKINKTEDLAAIPFEDLVKAYDYISNADISENQRGAAINNIQTRIALNLKERSIDEDKKKALSDDIKHKDINWLNTFMKVLSHFDDAFPEMQGLSKMFDEAIFKGLESAEKQKFTHRKLAENVIKEYNKRLGIAKRAGFWLVEKFLDQKHKYFGFLDDGNGKVITLNQAENKNLSGPQIEYLKFVRETLVKRNGVDVTSAVYDTDMDILKLSKGTSELFQTEGLVSAVGGIMSNDNLGQVKIYFTNPKTGKKTLTEFKNARTVLSQYAKDGSFKDKAKATKLLVEYTIDAKTQYKKGYHADGSTADFPKKIQGKPTLNDEGKLRGRFDGEYKGASYSKDFFTALNLYIDDTAHIENVSPLIPIINSIEYLAEKGVVDEKGNVEHQKKYLAEWMRKWQNQHIFKHQNKIPGLDEVIRFLRHVTSLSTMMFNFKAQGLNVAVGQYGNFVELGPGVFAKGLKRLFDPTKRGLMLDIAKKYKAISVDLDSNPIRTGWGIFSSLGFAGTKWGEVVNQVGALAGLMSEEDYNSFEYVTNEHGVKELVIKKAIPDNKKKELEERILEHINKVSDVHGKYSEKDRRNIMNSEFGKALLQYKIYMPDVWRMRFGEKGRWTTAGKTAWKLLFKKGRDEMRQAMRDSGGAVKHFQNDDVFKRNLRGAIITATLLILVNRDDEDNELLERFLSDVLFIFDPDNAKFTITRPVAAVGTIERFIDALDHAAMNEADDFYKEDGKYGDEGDSKVRGDVMGLLPGKKIIDEIIEE